LASFAGTPCDDLCGQSIFGRPRKGDKINYQHKNGRSWAALFALLVAECSSGFEWTMVYAALPTFYKTYGDPIGVGWMITIFFLISAAVTAIGARLGDIYGRRRLLIIMLAFAAAGSLISAFSNNLFWMTVGRAIQGMSAAVLPLCIGLVREIFPPKRGPLYVGIVLGAAGLAASAGLVLGGVIIDHFAWQAIFYTSAGLAFAGVVLVLLLVPRSPRSTAAANIDVLGGVLFVPGVAAILFAITKAKEWGWLDQRTLGLLAGGLLVLWIWARHELRHKNPLIDVRLFANRQVALANVMFALCGIGALQIFQFATILLQQPTWTGVGFGVTATVAGLLMLPSQLAGLFGSPWSGHIAGRFGARRAAISGGVILTAGWLALAFYHGAVWYVSAVLILSSVGLSVVYAAVPNAIVEVVPVDRTSEATGVAQVVRATSSAIGAQIVTFLMASSTVSDPTNKSGLFPSEAAYVLTCAYIAATGALVLLTALMLPKRATTVFGARTVRV
jgi:MFS family permease